MSNATRTVTAPTFTAWLNSRGAYLPGELGYIARHVTADDCLTATDPGGVRDHAITAHGADQHQKARALKALTRAEDAYQRHLDQLQAACRRTRYTLLPAHDTATR